MLKLPSRKLESLFVLWSFFLLKLLSISINLYMVMHGILFKVGAPSCYLELLDKLQKAIWTQICCPYPEMSVKMHRNDLSVLCMATLSIRKRNLWIFSECIYIVCIWVSPPSETPPSSPLKSANCPSPPSLGNPPPPPLKVGFLWTSPKSCTFQWTPKSFSPLLYIVFSFKSN